MNVLLGAGSTLKLSAPERYQQLTRQATVSGTPSTQELTERVAGLQLPLALQKNNVMALGPNKEDVLLTSDWVPACKVIMHCLRSTYQEPNFEHLINALEQLEPFALAKQSHGMRDDFRPVLASFVQDVVDLSFLINPPLITETRLRVYRAIREYIADRVLTASTNQPEADLRRLFTLLAEDYHVRVFTLNYDDLIDRADGNWFDGFSIDLQPQGIVGRAFDTAGFAQNWRHAEKLLVHMHGSVLYDVNIHYNNGLVRFNSAQEALQSSAGSISSTSLAHGIDVSNAPIISGLSKAARLTLNPQPYGHYYRIFMESVIESPRLLIIGYGGADPHVNAWLREFSQIHGSTRRVSWITYMSEEQVGTRTAVKDLIGKLAGPGQFHDMDAYAAAGDFLKYGHLALTPSGFPLRNWATLDDIITWLS
jgi:hypothetical protein